LARQEIPYFMKPTSGPYPEPIKSQPQFHTLFPEDPSPIYPQVSQVTSSL